MSLETFFVAALVLIGAFWLIVLPYRLSKGILHKLGYHAYCGRSCPINLEGHRVDEMLEERFKTGVREGMRTAAVFGADRSRNIVAVHSPLPEWKPEDGDGATVGAAKEFYQRVRFLVDVTHDQTAVTHGLAVGLGLAVRSDQNPSTALDAALAIVAAYSGVVSPEATEANELAQ